LSEANDPQFAILRGKILPTSGDEKQRKALTTVTPIYRTEIYIAYNTNMTIMVEQIPNEKCLKECAQ